MNSWNFRDEILVIAHRWYEIILFVMVGTLIGLGISFLVPASFRASQDLYLGLNPYRSPYEDYTAYMARQSFRLVDDYKNWQMEQLEQLVLTDQYLDEVLLILKVQDSYWNDFTSEDFRQKLDVLWRTVGEWHLVVEDEDPQRAVQAVEIWGDVILEKVSGAIEHSKQVVALDVEMDNLSERQIEYELRLDRLMFVKEQISELREDLEDQSDDQPVSSADHWKILGLVSLVVDWDPQWIKLLDDAPKLSESPQEYQKWLQSVLFLINEEIEIFPGQILELTDLFENALDEYKIETKSSEGLASTLVVKGISGEKPEVETVIQRGDFLLLGGFFGLLAWGIWVLTRISKTER